MVLFEWMQFLQYEALQFLEIQSSLDLSWSYLLVKPTRLSSSLSERQHSPVAASVHRPIIKLDSRAVSDNQCDGDLLEVLKEYERVAEQLMFVKASHTCKVCFGDKLGVTCIRFPSCNHVYCKECMRSYFEIKIAEGAVNGLHCPEDKCASQASPGQVYIFFLLFILLFSSLFYFSYIFN